MNRPTETHVVPLVRRIPFEFPEDLDPVWIPDEPEWAAMLNGASLTMPYLEPFLIRSLREALEGCTDPQLQADGQAFMSQEGQHFRAHRRFNDLLKRQRYPALAEVEAQMALSYERLARRSLRCRMAYTAGFESMTMGVTRWLVEDRVRLFRNADPRVVSFVLWHMVEETEHKRVAFDVYQACFGGTISGYLARMLGVFHGSLDVMRFSMRGYRVMLRTDGRWGSLRSRLRLAGWLGRFVVNVGPALLRAAMPGHDPRHERDPEWVVAWLRGYAQHPDGVPLVDTRHPEIPVPFPTRAEGVCSS
ncbi:metal-dependent hydrolase [Flagellatimonas centrodinii]|uniref:metal-dependent hydrolase n=1 Tax=Flagellatimonas centrodinii TaxID=2806210 RepID=UPI001FF76298|nr:metal-dependent hydrolase [Flagellatimonas centrodinii]ULQ46417.1 metal-dependent hydrolase [Flagellatimonas centrodinii]